MPGVLWSVWRSVRGIERTYRLLEYARWSHHGASLLWTGHLREGIADDGSPSGIEHAFRLESFQPDLFVLWSRWRDHSGALRLRELGRDEKVDRLVTIEAAPRETAPLLVYADWLETSERHDEAAVVRARLP